ncbi:MAG: hypothetical protein KAS36_07520 [Anaerolineales bacterium]|nr:hypothetical protein [Anaerolineales bacterium]
MYTTVVEHEGKLVYAALADAGHVLAIFSSRITEGIETICEYCQVRQACCCIVKKDNLANTCRICLDKERGVF